MDGAVYTAQDGSFSFRYPGDFKAYSKLLKTHKQEVNYKSPTARGYEIGVAVDPVRINSLDQFGSAQEVGTKVVNVELGKDGCLEAKLLGTSSERMGDVLAYTIEYYVENTHYTSQFVAKVIIKDGRLFVCTGKCKAKDFDTYGSALREAVGSFTVTA
ncbi:hypothetical protein JKP88DRAFT_168103 [Tribonema minus]|uniref:PsbP C-terminal domain-containing protein n=1 Tax=Tribonema minus TaxID=303371 RepID=A0A836CB55_9STRA|nr:hypothetical protein JKP88DRAFT_168103 [Tribonema minus]